MIILNQDRDMTVPMDGAVLRIISESSVTDTDTDRVSIRAVFDGSEYCLGSYRSIAAAQDVLSRLLGAYRRSGADPNQRSVFRMPSADEADGFLRMYSRDAGGESDD